MLLTLAEGPFNAVFAPLDPAFVDAIAPAIAVAPVDAPFAPLVAAFVKAVAPVDAASDPADSSGAFRAAAALAFGLSGRVLLTKDTLSPCADFVCLTSPPVL